MTINKTSLHSVHIPVMGTGFTIDSPIKVAPYGISSVISIGDDELCEYMREYWAEYSGEEFTPIPKSDIDRRAKRIREYLNLVNRIVKKRFQAIQKSAFETGSEITKYFDMLKESLPLKKKYNEMLEMPESPEKAKLQDELRSEIQSGSIDVNIMTKLDRDNIDKSTGEKLPEMYSDAISVLRGYAESDLENSSIVFSAGFNRRLYAYLEKCKDFFPNKLGEVKKKVVLKVSDFRSSLTQGKFLAKKGIWVSEHRIESGLNCGGHAFATQGLVLGPILDEFKKKKDELVASLYEVCNNVLKTKELDVFPQTPKTLITVQGGIGTYEEDKFLLDHYGVDGTGWATPFLLVPEATTVDDETRQKLVDADQSKLFLSKISPLGIPFNALAGSESEIEKWRKVDEGKPGSPCPKGHLVSNVEFTKVPICTASRTYQRLKVKDLESQDLAPEVLDAEKKKVYTKACLCEDLAAPAVLKRKMKAKRPQFSAVCPGPNLAYFSKIATLKEMVEHVYGKINLRNKTKRNHMFLNELAMYIEYWADDLQDSLKTLDKRKRAYLVEFKDNLMDGIAYYKDLIPMIKTETEQYRELMMTELMALSEQLETIFTGYEKELVVV